MSRIGDLLGRAFAADATPGVGFDLGPNEPLPGQKVTPERDQADTERKAPFGATGTINMDGYLIPSEYNSDLTRWAALEVYERMRRSDPSVRETLWHMKGPIINAEWTVQPPDDADDTEREIAEFVRAALFEWLEQPWTQVLEHALSYLDFGHSVFEPVFQVVTRELTVRAPVTAGSDAADEANDMGPGDGDEGGDVAGETDDEFVASELPSATKTVVEVPIPLPPDTETKILPARQFTTWRKFSPRLPRTIWKWHHDEFGELTSITQMVWANVDNDRQGYRTLEIPAANLLVFTHDKWGDEYTGIPLLRSAYKPWIMKEMLEKIAGIAYERHGVGYIIGYLSRERGADQAERDAMLQMLQELRQDAVAVLPGQKQMSGANSGNGYLVEILSPQGGIPNFEPMLTYYRGEIAGAMLARFKELGHAASGSRATADVQAAVWYNALHACARYLEAIFNTAIRRLIDLNYPNVKRYPKLKASGIEARNLLEFAQAVSLLVDAKVLSPDEGTRQWARASIDAPAEDRAEARARAIFDAQQAAAGMGATETADPGGGAQSPTQKLKATIPVRGNETDSGENPARPRVENT